MVSSALHLLHCGCCFGDEIKTSACSLNSADPICSLVRENPTRQTVLLHSFNYYVRRITSAPRRIESSARVELETPFSTVPRT